MNNNYAHKETNFMHDIFSEKVNAKCYFILPSLPTVSAILSRAYNNRRVRPGKPKRARKVDHFQKPVTFSGNFRTEKGILFEFPSGISGNFPIVDAMPLYLSEGTMLAM